MRVNGYPGARERADSCIGARRPASGGAGSVASGRAAPESEHEVQRLRRILPRLQRSLGVRPNVRSRKPEQLDLVLPRPTCSVEQAVREHLTRPDAPVYYVENALVGSLFGLLCWDAIFAPLPGAFTRSAGRRPT